MHTCYVSGWCSAQPGLSMRKYTIPFVDLSVGDVCLPPNHPEAVRTPTGDICDRFRRFEFDEQVGWSSKINAVDVRYNITVKKLELTSRESNEKVGKRKVSRNIVSVVQS